MTIKLYVNGKSAYSFLSRESAQEFLDRQSAAVKQIHKCEIRETNDRKER